MKHEAEITINGIPVAQYEEMKVMDTIDDLEDVDQNDYYEDIDEEFGYDEEYYGGFRKILHTKRDFI